MDKESRFIDNGDNTITDSKTGLMWVKDHVDEEMTFKKAEEACKELVHAGHNDWRLPTREELESILDLTKYNPAIDPIFVNTHSSWYWTITPCVWDTGSAWMVDFYNGDVSNYDKDNNFYVRPVRSSK